MRVLKAQNLLIGWAGPTILEAGTEEQKDKYLPGLLEGKDLCQLFSEPDSGSDLANSPPKKRDGDEYVINGSNMVKWCARI